MDSRHDRVGACPHRGRVWPRRPGGGCALGSGLAGRLVVQPHVRRGDDKLGARKGVATRRRGFAGLDRTRLRAARARRPARGQRKRRQLPPIPPHRPARPAGRLRVAVGVGALCGRGRAGLPVPAVPPPARRRRPGGARVRRRRPARLRVRQGVGCAGKRRRRAVGPVRHARRAWRHCGRCRGGRVERNGRHAARWRSVHTGLLECMGWERKQPPDARRSCPQRHRRSARRASRAGRRQRGSVRSLRGRGAGCGQRNRNGARFVRACRSGRRNRPHRASSCIRELDVPVRGQRHHGSPGHARPERVRRRLVPAQRDGAHAGRPVGPHHDHGQRN